MVGKSVRFYQRHITMPQGRCLGQVNKRSGCKPEVGLVGQVGLPVKGQPGALLSMPIGSLAVLRYGRAGQGRGARMLA